MNETLAWLQQCLRNAHSGVHQVAAYAEKTPSLGSARSSRSSTSSSSSSSPFSSSLSLPALYDDPDTPTTELLAQQEEDLEKGKEKRIERASSARFQSNEEQADPSAVLSEFEHLQRRLDQLQADFFDAGAGRDPIHRSNQPYAKYSSDFGSFRSVLLRDEVADAGAAPRDFKYFAPLAGGSGVVDVGTVVTQYNEEKRELERTLRSLAQQSFKGSHSVLVISDGIEKMSQSMRDYLVELFPFLHDLFVHSGRLLDLLTAKAPLSPEQSRHLALLKQLIRAHDPMYEQNEPVHLTFVVQNLNKHGERVPMRPFPDSKDEMDISLILKLDNRLKHNSHEWGFRAFANEVKADMVFSTDVGTLYDKHCLRHLTKYLRKHKNVSAVTGRQRVMTAKQQGSGKESWLWLDRMYRNAQCYDYESCFASFMAAFHMAGMLPVLPGPCGLYRRKDMANEDGPWDWYFEMVHTPPKDQDIVLGNLLLAEDRILSYSAALKTEEPRYTAIVPAAVFYFEAETDLMSLAFQRRRWINGTVAGYLFMTRSENPISESKHSWIRKKFISIMIICQLLMFAVVAISPALFLLMLYLSVSVIGDALDMDSSVYTYILFGIAIATYLAFVLGHHLYSRFLAFLFYVQMLIHAATIILAVTAAALTLSTLEWEDEWKATDAATPFVIAVIMALLPILVSFFTGGKSILLMLKCFIHFYLFMPTLVSSFGAYAFSRTFDLTWGNRPQSDIQATATQDLARAKEKLNNQSSATCGIIVLINVVSMVAILMSRQVIYIFLGITVLIFIGSAVQLLLSGIWYLLWWIRTVCKCTCGRLIRKSRRATSSDSKQEEKTTEMKKVKKKEKNKKEEKKNKIEKDGNRLDDLKWQAGGLWRPPIPPSPASDDSSSSSSSTTPSSSSSDSTSSSPVAPSPV